VDKRAAIGTFSGSEVDRILEVNRSGLILPTNI